MSSSEAHTDPGHAGSPPDKAAVAAASAASPAVAKAAVRPPAAKPPTLDEIAAQTATSLIGEIMAESKVPPDTPEHRAVEEGLRALLGFAIRRGVPAAQVDRCCVDILIAEITERMSRQVDEILHHPAFQALEAAWRGLKFVVDRVDFRENIRVELLNVSKRDLLEDFQDSPEIPKSGLFRLVYSAEYGVFGGRPFGLLCANYEFTPSPQDISLLSDCAAVATMAHAPFIAAASPRFFGLDSFQTLPQLSDIHSLFKMPQYTKWQAFRESDDARAVGLVMPRFLLRLPYGPRTVRVRDFEYEERVDGKHEAYLWGNAAFAFATRVADSFARYRWCPNIIGPNTGGTVEDLPLHEYEATGHIQTKIPTEIMITERREFEISEEGFIPFTFRRETENACFFSANSVQKPKTFARTKEGRQAELNYRLGTQLPYYLISCRLAHYIKVIQREHIGSWKERQDLERELNAWLNQYVAKQEVVMRPEIRARRPLRHAHVTVAEVAGNAGWYKVDVQVQPHFRYMGAVFQLDLMGRLDKE